MWSSQPGECHLGPWFGGSRLAISAATLPWGSEGAAVEGAGANGVAAPQRCRMRRCPWQLAHCSLAPLRIAKSSFEISVNQEFDSAAKRSSEQSGYVTYTSGRRGFGRSQRRPVRRLLLRGDLRARCESRGQGASIIIPRRLQTLLATSQYWDQQVDASRQSAPLLRSHRVGDPDSYPDVSQRDTLCAGRCFRCKGSVSVGQGNGSTAVDGPSTADLRDRSTCSVRIDQER